MIHSHLLESLFLCDLQSSLFLRLINHFTSNCTKLTNIIQASLFLSLSPRTLLVSHLTVSAERLHLTFALATHVATSHRIYLFLDAV